MIKSHSRKSSWFVHPSQVCPSERCLSLDLSSDGQMLLPSLSFPSVCLWSPLLVLSAAPYFVLQGAPHISRSSRLKLSWRQLTHLLTGHVTWVTDGTAEEAAVMHRQLQALRQTFCCLGFFSSEERQTGRGSTSKKTLKTLDCIWELKWMTPSLLAFQTVTSYRLQKAKIPYSSTEK